MKLNFSFISLERTTWYNKTEATHRRSHNNIPSVLYSTQLLHETLSRVIRHPPQQHEDGENQLTMMVSIQMADHNKDKHYSKTINNPPCKITRSKSGDSQINEKFNIYGEI
jgi:hypothetical protein